MKKNTDFIYCDIGEIFESIYYETINEYLALGWVLLGVYSVQHTDNATYPKYSIGWSKLLGDPKIPESKYKNTEPNF